MRKKMLVTGSHFGNLFGKPIEEGCKCCPDGVFYERVYINEFIDIMLTMYNASERFKRAFELDVLNCGNVSLPLKKRAEIVNGSDADVYIEFHTNAAGERVKRDADGWQNEAEGIRLFHWGKSRNIYSAEGLRLAGEMMSAMCYTNFPRPRGDIYMLNKTNMTAVLIELGFHDNKEDLKRLKDYKADIALSVLEGMHDYCTQ